MLRAFVPVSLLAVALALPAPAAAERRVARGGVPERSPGAESARVVEHHHRDACRCFDCLQARRWPGSGHVARGDRAERPPGAESARTVEHRRHRDACPCFDCLQARRWPGSGHGTRTDRAERSPGAESARTVEHHRRHGDACACRPCLDRRRGGDTVIVLAPAEPGRAPDVVIRDRDSTRILLDAVSVRQPRRDDGVLAISDSGGDVLVRGERGPTVLRDGGAGEAGTRAGRTGSGSLYLHVRADGSLEIRSR